MDIGRSVGYVFEDRDWGRKVLIGGVVNLIPIVSLAAIGYTVRTMRNVATSAERPLPDWDDFGGDFIKGLLVAVAGLIYSLPAILVNVVLSVIGAMAQSGRSDEAAGVVGLCVAGLSCLVALYAFVVALWTPAATMNYAATGEFSAFFQFGRIWELISHNLGGYILALLVSAAAAFVAALAGIVLCVIGVAFTSFIAMLVYAYLLGQLLGESGRLAAGQA